MRIVQIIDSLNAGGAERMAVNYANSLAHSIEFSGLISTRDEGVLRNQIKSQVSYLFLRKKKRIDFLAIIRLRKYLRENKVDIIHAHSSSFFIAVLTKFTIPKIKIIWHDHYGARIKETKKENRVLIFLSMFFYSIFVVNLELKEWSKKNMNCSRIFFIANFTRFDSTIKQETHLKGKDGKRIVVLANLKKPKNHILILKAFFELELNKMGWSLHLVGRDYNDAYSDNLKTFIKSNLLKDHIYLYGEKSDVSYILSQASIGVLASTQEGFPVTLLEYGLAKLPVISTNAGYCSTLIKDKFNGLLFNPLSELEINLQLSKLIEDEFLRSNLGGNLKQSVDENYSEQRVIEQLIVAYNK
ncbi:glycosyltransferase [Flavobacterium sp. LC2016-12]|uniref:glycosyltransferase n=1 Tax=Flavobacterium sp. LC2016-12 TaxID=2783794 RepID=UPI00188D3538|nr:glycosyltransferase [Flavobacterium sp. LC2016-12]MBF4465635.1 glycosyltransferase [Flavobacterium sp. LC2016-12]